MKVDIHLSPLAMEMRAVLALSVAIGHDAPFVVEEALRMYESERMARHELESRFARFSRQYRAMHTFRDYLRRVLRSIREGVTLAASLLHRDSDRVVLVNLTAILDLIPPDDSTLWA